MIRDYSYSSEVAAGTNHVITGRYNVKPRRGTHALHHCFACRRSCIDGYRDGRQCRGWLRTRLVPRRATVRAERRTRLRLPATTATRLLPATARLLPPAATTTRLLLATSRL